MKNIYHNELEARWNNFSIFEQMANIGAEVGRAMKWKTKGNSKISTQALYRALELIDFTINDKKNLNSLKEIVRVREVLVDFIIGDNVYKSTNKQWEKYFFYFNIAARNKE